MLTWAFAADRAEGDTTVAEQSSGYVAVLFHSRSRDDYHPVTVRLVHTVCPVCSVRFAADSKIYAAVGCGCRDYGAFSACVVFHPERTDSGH